MVLDTGKLTGRGIGFPPGIDANGKWRWSTGVTNIRESIRVILQTEPLERLMMPTFGSGIKRMLFQPNTVATRSLIEEAIVTALKRWERRINVTSVLVEADPDNSKAVNVLLNYRLVYNNEADQQQLRVLLSN